MDNEDFCIPTAEWRCLKCREIPWDYESWNEKAGLDRRFTIEHHDSFEALDESAASGCLLCRNFRVTYIHATVSAQFHIREYRISFARFKNDFTLVMGITEWGEIPPRDLSRQMGLFWAAGNSKIFEAPVKEIKRFAPQTLETDLNCLVNERILPWIDDCIHQRGRHKSCAPPPGNEDGSFRLPTRLVDVGDGQELVARLVETHDLPLSPKQEYLTLSYCWGQSNDPAKTTERNIGQRKERLDLQRLPNTIQDAIKLTRLMGVRYIWVDALCIIQASNDEESSDWLMEAPKMASYYANARCLISATGASDSSQGIFRERIVQSLHRKDCAIAFDQRNDRFLHVSADDDASDIKYQGQPLMKRGWCFQERLLSPRALHWCQDRLLWQCGSVLDASENYPEGDGVDPRKDNTSGVFQETAAGTFQAPWHSLVSRYLSARLTYPTDRLAAIQGLGSSLAAKHGVTYFAGVFSTHLPSGLAWTPGSSRRPPKKLAHFPTWSWASCLDLYGPPPLDDVEDRVQFSDLSSDEGWQSMIRCDLVDGVFPLGLGSEVDFGTPEKRSLRFEAPIMGIRVVRGRSESCDNRMIFQDKTIAPDGFVQFDTFDPLMCDSQMFLLVLSVQRDTESAEVRGIAVQPRGKYFERVGSASLVLTWNIDEWEVIEAKMEEEMREVILI